LAEHLTFNQGVTGSRPVRPTTFHVLNSPQEIFLARFLNTRRQGISPRTLEFYQACLKPFVANYKLTHNDINLFLSNLGCRNGKNAYYRAIRAFCNWCFRQGFIKDNPITKVDAPKMTKVISPSLTPEQVEEGIKGEVVSSISASGKMGTPIGLKYFVKQRSQSVRAQLEGTLASGSGDGSGNVPGTTT
jgi:hypothetical protein